jgi:hypothetical protein
VSTPFRTWFGEQIVDHDLSVTALSHLLDTYDGTIEDWLAGRAVPSRAECVQLAELFEVAPSRVLQLAGYAEPDDRAL